MTPASQDHTSGLTAQQRAAFDVLRPFCLGQSDHAMAVLSGFAGTGKTYLVARLLKALEPHQLAIAVAAPTNKAVRVLRSKMQEDGLAIDAEPIEPGSFQEPLASASGDAIAFSSIHALLGLQLKEEDDGSQSCKKSADSKLHNYDLVVIDECSMLGDELFSMIVTSKRETLILFVGDPAQLPPIEKRANLNTISPTFSKIILQARLTDVVRQAKDNPIIKLSVMLRQAIEENQRIEPLAITMALPPIDQHPSAALVQGGRETAVSFASFEIEHDRDARIIAYTNQTVIDYNARVHRALYGETLYPFSSGEPVIAQSQCSLLQCLENGTTTGIAMKMITSEEATLTNIAVGTHPYYPNIPAYQIILRLDNGKYGIGFVPQDQNAYFKAVNDGWALWREMKMAAATLDQSGQHRKAQEMAHEAKAQSKRNWSLKSAFAPIRHAYAITAHKSQGSTFDTAIVDLQDMAMMKSAFHFNRGLYVAVTRPRTYLAIVA